MNRTKTRLILGAVLGILGLGWVVLGAIPVSATSAGVGTLCKGELLFKMNIIGVSNPKTAKLTNTDRKTIFVALGGKNGGVAAPSDIWLTQGPFMVCDGNSWLPAVKCDGTPLGNNTIGAVFQLPCDANVPTTVNCTGFSMCYDVFFRALGTPGGGTTITTCGQLSDGSIICSSNNTGLISRNKGTPKFVDVTNALTSLVCPSTSFCAGSTLPLFNSDFQNFLWEYDNQGLKNGMIVFCGESCSSP